MNKFRNTRILVYIIMAVTFLQCATKEKDQTAGAGSMTDKASIWVKAGDFVNTKCDVIVLNEKTGYVKATKGGWLQYAIQIPVAGRYRVSLYGQSTDSSTVKCWIEDYADNAKGRTYNITGNMLLPKANGKDTIGFVQKEGSPLDAGNHSIRLHYDSGAVLIDKILFTLLKPHKNSPQVITQSTNGKRWELTWSDEFDGQGLPDTSKWVFDMGDWGWGNNELQYYTVGRTENARQENGNLIIEARKNDNGHAWTSARLTTRGKESFLYGKIEFRAKVPIGRGTWSAGWLLGDEYVDEKSWPACGEVDVLETVGFENDSITGNGKAHASIHCDAYYFKLNNQPTKIEKVVKMNSDFHIYAIEWLPTGITIFIDGKKYFTYKDTRTPASWPYNKPQNIILNLAMGGGWGGQKGVDPTLTSQQLIVDYVRVYGLK